MQQAGEAGAAPGGEGAVKAGDAGQKRARLNFPDHAGDDGAVKLVELRGHARLS